MFSVLIPAGMLGRVGNALGRLPPAQRLGAGLSALWERLWRWVGRPVLKDERAASILPYMFLPLIWIPLAVAFALRPSIGMAYVYLIVLMGPNLKFYAAYTALSHHNAHIPNFLFKPPYDKVQWYLIEYLLGPFHGSIPGSFPYSHVRMHHVCDNDAEDPSSTLYFDRDSLADFLRYAMGPALLYIGGVSALIYFYRKKRTRSFRQMLFGFCLYYGIFAVVLVLNWKVALVCMLMPLLLNAMAFSIINWAEHGFADPADPFNVDTNTSTITGPMLPLNENHHYAHHLKPANQWYKDPDCFEAQRERLSHLDPPVFAGLQWADLWKLMVAKRYGEIAKYYVIVNRDRRPEEIPDLLRSRMKRVLSGCPFAVTRPDSEPDEPQMAV
jgi:fatty acid desaturase